MSYSEFRFYVYKMLKGGTSLAVQWLRLHFPMKGLQVRSSVWELRSHITTWPKDQDVKQKPCCNTVNRLLKWSILKKNLKINAKKEKRNLPTLQYTSVRSQSEIAANIEQRRLCVKLRYFGFSWNSDGQQDHASCARLRAKGCPLLQDTFLK